MQDEVLPRFPMHLTELKKAEICAILSQSDGTVEIMYVCIYKNILFLTLPQETQEKAHSFTRIYPEMERPPSQPESQPCSGGEIHPRGPMGPGDEVFNRRWDS